MIRIDIDPTKFGYAKVGDDEFPRRVDNIPDPVPLPEAHQHDSDVAFPVVGFDFNQTLTPDMEYPIASGPYPGVKEVLDTLKSRGCCLHIMTSGLYYGTQDIPVYRSRGADRLHRR